MGETIQGRSIRHATIRNYVNAATKLHCGRDLPSPYGADIDYITVVLKAVKKYEKQPDRRDMIHDEVIHHMEKQRQAHNHDTLEAALLDWIYLGRFVGYRSIEWCQQHHHKFQTIENRLWTGPTCYAFIDEDFQFFTSDKQPIYDKTNLTWDSIGYVTICFRKQKNNRNYELVSYFRDTINPAFCLVHAALRICQRAARLGVPSDEPLGVYSSTQGRYAQQRCYITNHQVATFL